MVLASITGSHSSVDHVLYSPEHDKAKARRTGKQSKAISLPESCSLTRWSSWPDYYKLSPVHCRLFVTNHESGYHFCMPVFINRGSRSERFQLFYTYGGGKVCIQLLAACNMEGRGKDRKRNIGKDNVRTRGFEPTIICRAYNIPLCCLVHSGRVWERDCPFV